MSTRVAEHSSAWVTFSYASFIGSMGLVGAGLLFAPIDIWVKGYLAMGIFMLVQSCITVTKTMRDVHEAARLTSRIDDARTEKLLMDVARDKA